MEQVIVGWQELPKNAELRVGELILTYKYYSQSFVRFEKVAEDGELEVALSLPDTTMYEKHDGFFVISQKGE